jgi:hypothetical protein
MKLLAKWAGCLSLGLCVATGTLKATAIANGSITLTQFQISVSSGTINLASPITATAFGEALDSFGGFDQLFNSMDDGSTSAAALTSLAAANAQMSALLFTGGAVSSVNIPEINAFGSSTARSGFSGSFQIVQTNAPVNVQFKATFNVNQSVQTTGGGVSATSEIIFTTDLDTGDTPLFFDNILQIGPNSSSAVSANPSLTNSLTLDPNTPYAFFVRLDSETTAQNAVPEPASLVLAGTGLVIILAAGRIRLSARAPK